MRQVVNSYVAKSVVSVGTGREVLVNAWALVGRVPNFAWLMLIFLTVSALSVSTLLRSREEYREAQATYAHTQSRIEGAREINQNIRRQTEHLQSNPRAGELAAQQRLRLVRRNEIVVAVK